jgi:alkanesulfonate monooxygenase SsuD/methylene tetrahydromethanopterin reductase-like flavin-dependent oxidoreductase (luciferase family)
MPDLSAPLKLGADIWNQYTNWPAFKATHLRAEELGYDSLWTMDHIYPPFEPEDGPIFEALMAMAPIAELTTKPSISVMVASNTYRNPALLTKMMTTLDHISGGRAILSVGAGWSEHEHRGFGFEMGASVGERLRWLKEALPVMRGMLDGTRPSAAGEHYHMLSAENVPPPIQQHMPLLIGGSGRKVTLRLVAEYADICNIGGSPSKVADLDAVLVEHCEAVGRDEKTIERSIDVGVPTIRDSRAQAFRDKETLFAAQRSKAWLNQPTGTPEDVFEWLARYVDIGYHHLVFYWPAPCDEETMVRMATEVRPRLEAMISPDR